MTEAAASLGAVLLAAGCSRRLGQPKQLVSIDNQVLVARQADLLLSLRPACVVVVTGAYSTQVLRALTGRSIEIAHNADWQQGMGQSIACGINAMPERVRAALLLLCDQWLVDTQDLGRLVNAWGADPRKAAVAHWEKAYGPPVIFPRSEFSRLRRLRGEHGARHVLKRVSGGVNYVPMEHASVDIDLPADLP